MLLQINNLSFQYSDEGPWILSDINLQIKGGESLAIVGPTGSGKSTLVQHFNGLLRPTKGTIKLNGVDYYRTKQLKEWRRQVGMVFQYPEHQFFEENVLAELTFAPHNFGIPAEEIPERLQTAMASVGLKLEEFRERSPFTLSGGEKRRVAIAAVLAAEPEIIIFDEPTAGLDPRGREQVLHLLQQLHRQGRTVVLITHRMEEVLRLATRVIILNQGRLFFVGPPAQVVNDVNFLPRCGLELPELVALLVALQQRGWPVKNFTAGLAEIVRDISHTLGNHPC